MYIVHVIFKYVITIIIIIINLLPPTDTRDRARVQMPVAGM